MDCFLNVPIWPPFPFPYHAEVSAALGKISLSLTSTSCCLSVANIVAHEFGGYACSTPLLSSQHRANPLNIAQKSGTLATSEGNGKVELARFLHVNTHCLGGWMDGPEQVKDSSLACRNVGVGGEFSTLVTSSSFSRTNGQSPSLDYLKGEVVWGPKRPLVFSLHRLTCVWCIGVHLLI